MSGRKTQPKAMTLAELEADANAAVKAAQDEANGIVESQSDAAAAPVTPASIPQGDPSKAEVLREVVPQESAQAPQVNASAEFEALKAEMAEKDARINELTKRIRDEDGRNGGRLAQLQDQVSKISEQLAQVMAENRELKNKPSAPPPAQEPDPLDTEFPEVAKGIDRRTRPVMDAAARAEQLAREAKEDLQKLRAAQEQRDYLGFLDDVRRAVPKMEQYNSDPSFIEWCRGQDATSPYSRQEILNICASSRNAKPVIGIFQQWEKEKNNATAASPDAVKAAQKPTVQAQTEVPKSAAPVATKPAKTFDAARRLKEIEDKVFKFGNATAADREEYYKLLDAKERGEFS